MDISILSGSWYDKPLMRTKIIATIGPKSESRDMIFKFVEAGMDIARMNFSHCTYDEYRARKALIAEACVKFGRKVAIQQDLKGPRLRVGKQPEDGRTLTDGEDIVFTTDSATMKDGEIYINDPYIHSDIAAGDPIYLSSGEMELVVTATEGKRIMARVLRGGILLSDKGVNVPNTKLTTSGLTDKDIEDVKFAVEEGVDYVALSFVQDVADIRRLREIIGGRPVKIISKIEMALALKNIDEIIKASDGIMVARGDLGTEISLEKVPFVQKNLIRQAAWHAKPSITATQMLSSMMNHAHPTRAEVSDIANAVWDGTDAVMLSDETAAGKYPLEALQTLIKVTKEAEESHFNRPNLFDGE